MPRIALNLKLLFREYLNEHLLNISHNTNSLSITPVQTFIGNCFSPEELVRRRTHAQPKRLLITDCKIWRVSYILFFLFQPSLSHLLRAPRYLPETDILQR